MDLFTRLDQLALPPKRENVQEGPCCKEENVNGTSTKEVTPEREAERFPRYALVVGVTAETSSPLEEWFQEDKAKHYVCRASSIEEWCEALRSAYRQWRTGEARRLYVLSLSLCAVFDNRVLLHTKYDLQPLGVRLQGMSISTPHALVNAILLIKPKDASIIADAPFSKAVCVVPRPTSAALRRRIGSNDSTCYVAHFSDTFFPTFLHAFKSVCYFSNFKLDERTLPFDTIDEAHRGYESDAVVS